MVVAATVGAAAIGAAASSSAASKASKAQERAAQQASDAEREMFEASRADMEPWRQAGMQGLNRLSFLLGLPPVQVSPAVAPMEPVPASGGGVPGAVGRAAIGAPGMGGFGRTGGSGAFQADITNDFIAGSGGREQNNMLLAAQSGQPAPGEPGGGPVMMGPGGAPGEFGMLTREFTGAQLQDDPGYQFRLREGQAALDRSASARGGMFSGAQLKGLNRFGQEFASNEFTNAFNRNLANRHSLYNMLSGISGTGQVAAQQVGSQGMQLGRDIGSNLMGAGNARASGYLGRSNALQGGVNQLASAYNQGVFGGGGGVPQSAWGDVGYYQGRGSPGGGADADYMSQFYS